tara:strand:- start:508 stop:1089 length:582 start_codon:yes stop_codon:yes gene_type:complete
MVSKADLLGEQAKTIRAYSQRDKYYRKYKKAEEHIIKIEQQLKACWVLLSHAQKENDKLFIEPRIGQDNYNYTETVVDMVDSNNAIAYDMYNNKFTYNKLELQKGTILKYFEDCGYGFIKPDNFVAFNNENIFFHINDQKFDDIDFSKNLEQTPNIDNRVVFTAEYIPNKGPKAVYWLQLPALTHSKENHENY